MLKQCSVVAFVAAVVMTVFFLGTVFSSTQLQYSQETKDAVQDQRLSTIETTSNVNTRRIDELNTSLADLTSTMNRFTGIGIGFGAALTMLQGIQIFLQARSARKT